MHRVEACGQVVLEASLTMRNLCHKEQLKSTIVRGEGLALCTNFAQADVPEVHLYAAQVSAIFWRSRRSEGSWMVGQAYNFLTTRPDVQYALMQSQKVCLRAYTYIVCVCPTRLR